MMAAKDGSLDCVKYFVLSKGSDVNAKEKYGSTALDRAAKNGHLNVTQFVLNETNFNKGINCKDNGGRTALHYTAKEGNFECFKSMF